VSFNRYIAKQLGNPAGFGGKLIFSVMNRQNRPLYNETIRLLVLSNSDSVLDIGCGNGYVLNMIAHQYDCKLTGIDISTNIIENASKRNHKFVQDGKLTFSSQNVNVMSFADSFFEKAYTINTVYFWENLETAMSEIWRVLKPNGIFINTLFSDEKLSQFSHTRFGYKRYTIEELTSVGNNLGFAVNVIPILNGIAYCILYQK
jgi:ubiquinone/menaquinone biosynthesis C-methylase UbiE